MASYHHGNLKVELLARARTCISKGPSQPDFPELSLRDLARQAGVSPTAVYHHFPSKDHLLQELARAFLEELAQRLENSALEELGVAYVEYFVEQPVVLDLAFGPRFSGSAEIRQLQTRIYTFLDRQLPPALPGDQDDAVGLLIWAVVHGLSHLYRIGALGPGAAACAGTAPELWGRSPRDVLQALGPLMARAAGDKEGTHLPPGR